MLDMTSNSPLTKIQRLQAMSYYEPAEPSSATKLDEYTLTPQFEPPVKALAKVQKLFIDGLRDAVARGLFERG
ncbi:hypothetical protein V7S43_005737 [Phytophthora oleae]|uniref:Uncharacterized protein n=1 Tax=Phytophthora oleae TaxID=2107226 RepID=A0ABD3FSU8_9STRA